MKELKGGVTNAKGFQATGFFSGVRKQKDDTAIIYSEKDCVAAGVFTKNTVKAAPVQYDMNVLKNSKNINAIVVNSGNANACTGNKGKQDTEKMAEITAEVLGLKKENVLVSSTGVIGVPLPIEKLVKGIKENYTKLSSDKEGSQKAASAIMTTDTFSKSYAIEFDLKGKKINMGGIAKGSGMIHPNMGTMLVYITTDISITKELLQKALSESTVDSYNMISVDGDTSTNDTVIVLANGLAGNETIKEDGEEFKIFKKYLHRVNLELAKLVVKDGEGAGKFIEVNIEGTKTKEDARKLAKSVINSNLVKTAFFGEDANWGRIVCAMGYTGIEFDLDKTDIYLVSDDKKIELMKEGVPLEFSEEEAKNLLSNNEIIVYIKMKEGEEKATSWGCDLSYDYVKINADYRT